MADCGVKNNAYFTLLLKLKFKITRKKLLCSTNYEVIAQGTKSCCNNSR